MKMWPFVVLGVKKILVCPCDQNIVLGDLCVAGRDRIPMNNL
jgi:hypothetical protein